jgi:MFS family permease
MADLNEGQSTDARPTRIRYLVLAATALMAVLLYLDPYGIAVAPPIQTDLELTGEEMRLAFGAFIVGYCLWQIPVGWLTDRFGARLVVSASVLAWSLFTGVTGLVSGPIGLVVARLIVGMGQAGAYPISARILSQWIPFQRRGLASSIFAMGGTAGVALAPLLTAWITTKMYTWRGTFALYTLVGIDAGILVWIWFRNSPREHSDCNAAEIALIEGSRPADASDPSQRTSRAPWISMVTSTSLWLLCLSQFTLNVAWAFLLLWLPTHLEHTFEFVVEQGSLVSNLPWLAGLVGCLLGGLGTDYLTRRLGLKWGRSTLGIGAQCLAGLGIIAAFYSNDPYVTIGAFVFALFASNLALGATLSYFQDAGGPYIATFLAWVYTFGYLGVTGGPFLLRFIAERYEGPLSMFCAGLLLVAGLAWFGVDARKPIMRPGEVTARPGKLTAILGAVWLLVTVSMLYTAGFMLKHIERVGAQLTVRDSALVVGFMAWAAIPFLALGIFAMRNRQRPKALAVVLFTTLLISIGGFYILFNGRSGLVFVYLPSYQLIVSAIGIGIAAAIAFQEKRSRKG